MTVNVKNSLAQIPWKPHFPFLLAAEIFAQKAVLPASFSPPLWLYPLFGLCDKDSQGREESPSPTGWDDFPPGEPVFKKEGTKVWELSSLTPAHCRERRRRLGQQRQSQGESQDALSSYLASEWLTLVIERLLAGCWSHHPHLPNRAIARAVTSPWPFLMRKVWLEPARMCLWGTRPYSSLLSPHSTRKPRFVQCWQWKGLNRTIVGCNTLADLNYSTCFILNTSNTHRKMAWHFLKSSPLPRFAWQSV